MYHSFFAHSSVDGQLGCSHVLVIVNSAAVSTGAHVSFSVLVSSGYMPSRGTVGSYGREGRDHCHWDTPTPTPCICRQRIVPRWWLPKPAKLVGEPESECDTTVVYVNISD